MALKGNKSKAQKQAAKKLFGQTNMQAGNYVANTFLPDTLAAHVDAAPTAADTEVLGKMKDLSKGMSAEQYQAAREQASKGLQSDLNTQMANLAKAQAQGRVYGAAGAAQQANALRADSEKRADLEQQNKLADMSLINQGTKDYATLLQAQEDKSFEKQKYNAGNDMALASSKLSAFMNTVGVGKTEEEQKRIEEIQKQMIEAAKG